MIEISNLNTTYTDCWTLTLFLNIDLDKSIIIKST